MSNMPVKYTSAPLDEILLDIQFDVVPNYSALVALPLYEAFKNDFPVFQELARVEPNTQMFGLPVQPQAMIPQFIFGTPPIGNRIWLISEKQHDLLQVQSDRFIANWRALNSLHNNYPGFEVLINKFEQNANKLIDFFKRENLLENLTIRQSQISYVNRVYLESYTSSNKIDEWFSLMTFASDVENFQGTINKVVTLPDGTSRGRLTIEIGIGLADNRPSILLQIHFRGASSATDLQSAIDFLKFGHNLIVTTFDDITTDKAKEAWGKI